MCMEASRSYVRVSVKVRVRVSVKVRVQVSVKDQCQLITKGMVSTSLYSCVRIGKINKLKTQGRSLTPCLGRNNTSVS